MARQVWGTFSVRDHTRPGAFVTDVLLYDRLVVPVPPDEAERARWEREGWQPDRLDALLEILGDRAVRVPWTQDRRNTWRTRFEASTVVARETPDYAFATSRTVLTEGLPSHVTGVQAVPSFSSLEEAETELGLRAAPGDAQPLPGGAAVSVLAHEFLVPDDPADRNDDCLRAAVDIASDVAYRRKRAAFWRWLREYFDDRNMCHPAAIRDAVEEMEALLEEQRALVRKARIRTIAKYAFAIGGGLAGFGAEGPVALAFAGSFISVGGVLADHLLAGPEQPRQVALLHDVRKHFGWGARP
ncbi:MAG TPA: hypothetical protein VF192_10635 [Longimicrobiales bacterium]